MNNNFAFFQRPNKLRTSNENKITVNKINVIHHDENREFGRDITNTVIDINKKQNEEIKPIIKIKTLKEKELQLKAKPNTDNIITVDSSFIEPINLMEVDDGKKDEASGGIVINVNPQLCEEYIDDIFEHIKSIEFDHLPNPSYMKQQVDINERMRGILIDWLIDVHLKFKLLPETMFLTVNLIDRYLEKKVIMRNKLQLVGVTAMHIACKYEEIYAPEVKDFVYITDKAYAKDEILRMENDIMATLEFNVTVSTSYKFLEIYNYFLKLDETQFMFCRYLLELFIVDNKMLKYNPSLLASTAIYMCFKINKVSYLESLLNLIGYQEDKLRECAKDVCLILDNVEKSSLQAVRKKFSHTKYLEVAKIKLV
jgi:cyclin B